MFNKEILTHLREREGLTRQQLAEKLGVSFSGLSNWEMGNRIPDNESIKLLAEFFNVDVGEFDDSPLEVEVAGDLVLSGNAKIENIEKGISDDLKEVKDLFFRIGYKIYVIDKYGLYKKLGFNNLVEYSEKRLGFGKSSTYNFLGVYEMINDGRLKKKKQFSQFNYSQLVEMLPLSTTERMELTSDLTANEIRTLKQIAKNKDFVSEKMCSCPINVWFNPKRSLEEFKDFNDGREEEEEVKTDIPKGQLYLDESEDVVEYHQNFEEQPKEKPIPTTLINKIRLFVAKGNNFIIKDISKFSENLAEELTNDLSIIEFFKSIGGEKL